MAETVSARTYRMIRSETVCLRAETEALTILDTAVRDGIRAFPRHGLEIAGVLTGSLADEMRIDAVHPLPMEYRSSPAFQPCAADLRFLKGSIARVQTEGTAAIGHFRSQTAGEPGPTEVDDIIAGLLNVSEPILLLIPASAQGIENARLYRKTGGKWVPLLNFPLIDEPLIDAPYRNGRPLLQRLSPQSRQLWRSRRAWAIAAIATVGIFASARVLHVKPSPPVNAPLVHREISLAVHPTVSGLRVEWDALSPQIAQAFSGMLTVQDGVRRLQIPLNRQQLGEGNTFYIPESPWVEVHLEVYRDGNHYTGEVVALPTGLPAQAAHQPSEQARAVEPKSSDLTAKPAPPPPAKPQQPRPKRRPSQASRLDFF
jgi:hypothetical protein